MVMAREEIQSRNEDELMHFSFFHINHQLNCNHSSLLVVAAVINIIATTPAPRAISIGRYGDKTRRQPRPSSRKE